VGVDSSVSEWLACWRPTLRQSGAEREHPRDSLVKKAGASKHAGTESFEERVPGRSRKDAKNVIEIVQGKNVSTQ
jgi:hypothetical protein